MQENFLEIFCGVPNSFNKTKLILIYTLDIINKCIKERKEVKAFSKKGLPNKINEVLTHINNQMQYIIIFTTTFINHSNERSYRICSDKKSWSKLKRIIFFKVVKIKSVKEF